MDFSHLKKHEVTDKTMEYPLFQIAGDPVPTLILKPATEANKPYFNAVLKRSKKNIRALQSGSITSKIMDEGRDEDRELYPKFVVVDWKNVCDANGEDVPFSGEHCEEFLRCLPDWIFDDIRKFAGQPTNFTNTEPVDVSEKAKN